jgi:integrase
LTKLDAKWIEKAKPGDILTDQGVTCEKLTASDGLFTVQCMVNGVRIHRTLGKISEGVTLTVARNTLTEYRAEGRKNRLVLPKGRKIGMTFMAAADQYILELKETGGKNIEDKESRLRLHLIPYFGHRPLIEITAQEIEKFKVARRKEFVLTGGGTRDKPPRITKRLTSDAEINREIGVFSHLYNHAFAQHWIDALRIKFTKYHEAVRPRAVFDAAQMAQLLTAAARIAPGYIFVALCVALSTCMRIQEILSMRWEHIYYDRLKIYIPEAKAGDRLQPMTEDLAEVLREWHETLPADCPWVFPCNPCKDGRPRARSGHRVDVTYWFVRLLDEIGVSPSVFHPHSMRHTGISHLVRAGVDLRTIQAVSGHKSLAMVMRYAQEFGTAVDSAMDTLQARVAIPAVVAAIKDAPREMVVPKAKAERKDKGTPKASRHRGH